MCGKQTLTIFLSFSFSPSLLLLPLIFFSFLTLAFLVSFSVSFSHSLSIYVYFFLHSLLTCLQKLYTYFFLSSPFSLSPLLFLSPSKLYQNYLPSWFWLYFMTQYVSFHLILCNGIHQPINSIQSFLDTCHSQTCTRQQTDQPLLEL